MKRSVDSLLSLATEAMATEEGESVVVTLHVEPVEGEASSSSAAKRQKGSSISEAEEPVVTSEAQRSGEVVMTKEDLVSKVKVLMEKGPENNVLNTSNAAERAKFLSILSETRSGTGLGHAESLTGDAMLRLLSG